jgi:hypothetical protein
MTGSHPGFEVDEVCPEIGRGRGLDHEPRGEVRGVASSKGSGHGKAFRQPKPICSNTRTNLGLATSL